MHAQHAIIEELEKANRRALPEFRAGDTVRVHHRIVEGDKERVQVFQGVVIRRSRGGLGATFRVRKVAAGGVGVERTYPLHSPRIEKIEIVQRGRVRRSRLYYLRDLQGKKARIQARTESGGSSGSGASVPPPPAES
ncbi:MAG: 50S ribosomal protein L19 [Deltaproteobacteria bacterium]|nr:50S ribosomal protein L19 [Deltaproteobacteria bacterium]